MGDDAYKAIQQSEKQMEEFAEIRGVTYNFRDPLGKLTYRMRV